MVESSGGFRERPRIGFALASLHSGSSCSVWPAVLREAARLDADLFCFPGGRLGASDGHEIQRNFAYELASPEFLDGIITWSSSLCGSLPEAEVDRFLDRYRSMPMLSLSEGVPGVPTVSIDFYSGTRELMDHAIRAHGFTRIAFLRGPENHPGAAERYAAYRDALEQAGIPLDPLLVSDPRGWDGGEEAMRQILDERRLVPGKDFRAVVAASDLMAFWAVRLLESRNVPIPQRLAVFGVNDSPESMLVSPPLTTVRSPFAEQGAQAVSALLAMIRDRARPGPRTLPSRLVVRESCGCPSVSMELARASTGAGRQEMLAALGPYPDALEEEATAVLDAAFAIPEGASPEGFLRALSAFLYRLTRSGIGLSSWQDGLSLLRRALLPALRPEGRERLEEAIGQARVMVFEAAERADVAARWQEERSAEALRALDRRMLMALDYGNFREALRLGLPDLGSRSAFVFRFDAKDRERAWLAAGIRDGESLPATGESFPARELVPPGILPVGRKLCYIVEPLFFRDFKLGYALIEAGPPVGGLYEELRASLSGVLRSIVLFEEAEEARRKAERADQVKSLLLGNVSHELRTPAELIRKAAERLLEEERSGTRRPGAEKDLARIMTQAEHQGRLLGDLIDLSRAEIEELDLERSLIDPRPLVAESFGDLERRWRREGGPEWRLELPSTLPAIEADPTRLRQILYNLLGNAAKFTETGYIRLRAGIEAGWIELRVEDSGRGIPADMLESVFTPFISSGGEGTGLGLSISRHLALLHGGSLVAESEEGRGSAFILRLPVPAMEGGASQAPSGGAVRVLLVSARQRIDPAVSAAFPEYRVERITAKDLSGDDADERIFSATEVAALVWDAEGSGEAEWDALQALRRYPPFRRLPFMIFGNAQACLLQKGAGPESLIDALALAARNEGAGPILAADDDPEALAELCAILRGCFPDSELLAARDGEEAWRIASGRRLRLAVLDLSMPRLGGIELIERMRSDERLAKVPVLALTSKALGMEDVKRIEGFSRLALGVKGTWTEEEARSRLRRLVSGGDELPAHSSALVRRALAFLHRNYGELVTRWRLAEEANVSEDYLTRLFKRELGISPWEYLSRYRIRKAKELLETTDLSIAALAEKVGFSDQAYFSRVFRKLAGCPPQVWRDATRSGSRRPSSVLEDRFEE